MPQKEVSPVHRKNEERSVDSREKWCRAARVGALSNHSDAIHIRRAIVSPSGEQPPRPGGAVGAADDTDGRARALSKNGHRLASFPYVEASEANRYHQHIYEVTDDNAANAIANISIPWHGISVMHCPSRVKPIKSLAGEAAVTVLTR